MRTVNIHEAKTTLSKILSDIENNKDLYVICRNGKPIADIIPHKKKSRLKMHPKLSKIKINYDPTEELSEDDWGEID